MFTGMIRLVTLGTFAAALLSSPALAAGGGGGGGGGGSISSTDPYAGAYSDQKPQPTYPKLPGTKATQKGKKQGNQVQHRRSRFRCRLPRGL
ncbi:hypothetical protein BRDID11002_20080 [Bradyrhizobium diazoefficiens]